MIHVVQDERECSKAKAALCQCLRCPCTNIAPKMSKYNQSNCCKMYAIEENPVQFHINKRMNESRCHIPGVLKARPVAQPAIPAFHAVQKP